MTACGASAVAVRDIVDGHRDATLRLLWSLVAHYSFGSLLDRDALAREILEISRAARRRVVRTVPGKSARGAAVAGEDHPPLPMPGLAAVREALGANGGKRHGDGGGPMGTHDAELLSLLLAWCQAICHQFGVGVHDFAKSFRDGRAYCLLFHFYHPSVSRALAVGR